MHLQLLSRPAEQGPAPPTRPLLRPGYRILLERGRVLFERGQRVVVFEGAAASALLPRLLPLLDGRRTAVELAGTLGPASLPAVERALAQLDARRLVEEGPPPAEGLPRPLRETVEMLAAEAELPTVLVRDRLASATVAVVGSSRAARAAVALVAEAGVAVALPRRWRDARADLVVAAPAAAEAGALRRLNRRALCRGTTWLPVLPYDGRTQVVGPLIVPDETACFTCYLLRRAAASGYADELLALERAPTAARPLAPLDRLAGELAALNALRWLATRDARLPGLLQTVELERGAVVAAHAVLRVPRCPSCSGLAQLAPPLPWHDLPQEQA